MKKRRRLQRRTVNRSRNLLYSRVIAWDISLEVLPLRPFGSRYLIYDLPQDRVNIRVYLVSQIW